METWDCVIVGAGHGGARAAHTLRQAGFEGSIALIGDEAELPYDRPSVSKDYLSGKKCFDRIGLHPESFWSTREIDLRLKTRVVSVAAEAHSVTCDNGEMLGYRHLIWSAGGAPRRLACPGADLPGVYYLRSKGDADALMAHLDRASCAVIIGGGYIGLEAAAVLRAKGIAVTLLEAQERVLARVTAEPVSEFYQSRHRAEGVDLRLSSAVSAILGTEAVARVQLSDGEEIAADLVIVGVGIIPETGALEAAGAEISNGILVDDTCQSSLPDIYCIGDCALLRDGPGVRIESVQNANDQAATVAKAICGDPQPYRALPWFWSNQYDLRLQTIGLNVGFDDWVLRGDPASGAFSLAYLKAGKLIAIDCINRPKDYVQGRKLIEAGLTPARETLADISVLLTDLLPAAVTSVA
ncbi:NAD(P)/FAD-dependent oxidoreductase [Leisingera sp. JC1]|uniref:NAD(P)/FAD-dependent oxidoreductase n=1 Tax=Leisingera sp. JC1 TaxID=1855282 RepID=UPI000803C079|nr:FAD-dependent oxidoreductase [Leisingera sp. JC1]OBY26562.1 pyridine nucleotide-disulfide oxidoreductase [Leisingera sp. JC1]